MQVYQEEYIANLKEILALAMPGRREKLSFEAYLEQTGRKRLRGEALVRRKGKLLREGLFPVLDHIYDADEVWPFHPNSSMFVLTLLIFLKIH